ncbi:MAG: metallophosphoesterase family protein [Roseiflexaceae bacterium]
MQYRLLHVSDLHAGPPFDLQAAERLVEAAHAHQPDLLVISGDFVQRADMADQWRTIKGLVARLPQPQLVVPGNHDVPLYNGFRRLLAPLSVYKREISSNLNQVFERPGLMVVGGNSAHGLTVDGGYVSRQQRTVLADLFQRAPQESCRVAVLHHHVINPPAAHGRRMIRNNHQMVELFDRAQVDLLLCGHIHLSYIGNTREVEPSLKHGTIICQCGTTTSRRGKGPERGRNSYNLITITAEHIQIDQYARDGGSTDPFEQVRANRFERSANGHRAVDRNPM